MWENILRAVALKKPLLMVTPPLLLVAVALLSMTLYLTTKTLGPMQLLITIAQNPSVVFDAGHDGGASGLGGEYVVSAPSTVRPYTFAPFTGHFGLHSFKGPKPLVVLQCSVPKQFLHGE